MNDFRTRYQERGIPLFDPETCSPYPSGECPRQGWYVIEMECTCDIPHPEQPGASVTELMDEETIRTLCENFDPSANGGKGIKINNNHLETLQPDDGKARGWIKALDYYLGDDGNAYMAGYLSLTPDGLHSVNNDEYWAWSGEYKKSEYIRRADGVYSPTVLRGLAFTNEPDRDGQPGISHGKHLLSDYITHSTPIHMNGKRTNKRIVHSQDEKQPDSADEKKDGVEVNNDDPENQEKVTAHSDQEEQEKQTHNDGEEAGWMGIVDAIAEVLGLGPEMTGDEIVAAVKTLKEDFDVLNDKVKEEADVMHSRRPSPRVLHSQPGKRMDRKVAPTDGTIVHRADGSQVRVAKKDMDLVTHCKKAVKDEETILGRKLTEAELNRIWAAAAQGFNGGQ